MYYATCVEVWGQQQQKNPDSQGFTLTGCRWNSMSEICFSIINGLSGGDVGHKGSKNFYVYYFIFLFPLPLQILKSFYKYAFGKDAEVSLQATMYDGRLCATQD